MTEPTPQQAAPNREPVLSFTRLAALVSAVVVAIGAAFVLIGWATADQVQQWAVIAGGIVTALGAVLAVVLPIFAAHAARAQVTPLANPQAVDEAPLVAAVQPAVDPSMAVGDL